MKAFAVVRQQRGRDEILAEYDAVIRSEQDAHEVEFQQFLAGARTALAWVLGATTTAPASASDDAPTEASMRREELLCDSIIYAAEPQPLLDPDFANGIEHALSWVRGAEELPPTPLGAVPVAPQRLCACG